MRRSFVGYYGNVTALDREVGTLLAALDALGLRDETLRHLHKRPRRHARRTRACFAKGNFYEPPGASR